MSHDDLNAAYQRISGRFPAEWDIRIVAQIGIGRRRQNKFLGFSTAGKAIYDNSPKEFTEYEFDLFVTVGGESYYQEITSLDEIERAAEAIIEQIAAADMADPVKSRRGLDRLADDLTARNFVGREHLSPANVATSSGSGRAA